ncbi:Rv3235 family protein [Nocardioides sp. R-C-SC26]|uniref:Rv3235 family protein n=1 Tax=Nocardioides sp. R-C-SC26 TaxID=2870414 RepID=UPI001E5F1FC7|nr:Rv3235 family protein [Nocardioides sp. R-C-SC26]
MPSSLPTPLATSPRTSRLSSAAGSSVRAAPSRGRHGLGDNVVPLRPPVPVATMQGTLALDLEPRLDPPPIDVDERRRRHDIEAWALRFGQAAVEIVGGDRPISQLVRWMTPTVLRDLDRRAVLVARAGAHQPGQQRVQPVRARVRSAHASFPDTDVAEVALHVSYAERSRALAARFERRRDRAGLRWVCTALDWS